MEVVDFTFNGESGVVIFDTRSGYNTIEFEFDNARNSIYVVSNTFSTTLDGDDDLNCNEGQNGISEELEIIYKGNDSSAIAVEIQRIIFELIDASILKSTQTFADDGISFLTLYKHKKTEIYSVKLSADDERYHLIDCVLSGQKKWLDQFVEPLNSILNLYSVYSTNPADQVALRLVSKIVKSVLKDIGIDEFDQILDDEKFVSKDKNLIEKASAELLIASVIGNSVSKIYDGLAKTRFSKYPQDGWIKVTERSNKRFDLDKFKDENPALYEKYLVEHRSGFLSRNRKKGTFPLEEKTMRDQIALVLNTLFH